MIVAREQGDGNLRLIGYTAFVKRRSLAASQGVPLNLYFDPRDMLMFFLLDEAVQDLRRIGVQENREVEKDVELLLSRLLGYEGSSYAVKRSVDEEIPTNGHTAKGGLTEWHSAMHT